MIALLIISMALMIVAAIVAVRDTEGRSMIVLGVMVTALLLMIIWIESIGYEEGQIDALKGDHSYEKVIRKEYKDSVLISTDTLFIKIEKL